MPHREMVYGPKISVKDRITKKVCETQQNVWVQWRPTVFVHRTIVQWMQGCRTFKISTSVSPEGISEKFTAILCSFPLRLHPPSLTQPILSSWQSLKVWFQRDRLSEKERRDERDSVTVGQHQAIHTTLLFQHAILHLFSIKFTW